MIWQESASPEFRKIHRATPVVRPVAEVGRRGPHVSLATDWRIRSLSTLILLLVSSTSATAAGEIDYWKQIRPVLAERCYACHGALKQEAGLRLDTAALAIKGGDSGPAITLGDAEASLLIQRITASDESERMPGEGLPLKPEQIAALRTWINQNAPAPADEHPETDPRDHWAFRPIVRPPVPQVANSAWVRNPIDAFIAQRHEQLGLSPQAEAPREVLVRRLYLDLIGLPPSQEDSANIAAESGDGWYEPLADRLLTDPRHGERWARHWMDIWRYSDWWGLGDQMRYSQPHIWHWRDWIIESLNANVPYDEMVRSMLAADELYPNDLEKLRATGFLARQYFLFNRNTWLEETVEHVSKGFLGLTMNCAKCHDHKFNPIAQVDYYRMRAFFEPYYVRMDSVPTEPDLTRDGIPRAFDGNLAAPTYLFVRGQESNPDKTTPIAPGVPEIFSFSELAVESVPIPLEASQPERRPWILKSNIEAAANRLEAAKANLVAAYDRLAKASIHATGEQLASKRNIYEAPPAGTTTMPDEVALARADVDAAQCEVAFAAAELSSVNRRADAMQAHWARTDAASEVDSLLETERTSATIAIAAQRQAELAKALFGVADAKRRLLGAPAAQKATIEAELTLARESRNKLTTIMETPVKDDDRFTQFVGAKAAPTRFLSTLEDDKAVEWSDRSTGRRKALAEWMTDPRNPLTARVAVNHIWNRHLGTPLAPVVFDLGRSSPPPSHPELLDWLAAELIESGWDMRHLHRLIVSSATYRMSSESTGHEAEAAKDADNVAWWRRNPIRLESEVIRDSILSLAGTLDLTRGGPPIYPDKQADSRQRSIYFFHSNNERNLFLATFDGALVTECYRRNQSVVPQQALAMTNSRLILDASKPVAERIAQAISPADSHVEDAAFVQSAFMLLLGYPPNDVESAASREAIHKWRALPNGSPENARSYLVWSLLNHTDFITLR